MSKTRFDPLSFVDFKFVEDTVDAVTGRGAAKAATQAGNIQAAGTERGIEEIRSTLGPVTETLGQSLPALLSFILNPQEQAGFALNNPLLRPLQEQVTRDVLQTQAAGGKSLSGGTFEELQNRLLPIGIGLTGERGNQLFNLANLGVGTAQTQALSISDLIGSGAAAQAAGRVGAANARAQGAQNLLGLGTTAALLSDERTKENIVKVGELDDGLGIYSYNYIGDDVTQLGVIAQEVEKVYPDAITEVDGIKLVNYEVIANAN